MLRRCDDGFVADGVFVRPDRWSLREAARGFADAWRSVSAQVDVEMDAVYARMGRAAARQRLETARELYRAARAAAR